MHRTVALHHLSRGDFCRRLLGFATPDQSCVAVLAAPFRPFLARLRSVSRSIFCVGFLPMQGSFLSTLVTSWLGYFGLGTYSSIGVECTVFGSSVLCKCFSLGCVMSRCVPREYPATSWLEGITVVVSCVWRSDGEIYAVNELANVIRGVF